jgi:TonB family protein
MEYIIREFPDKNTRLRYSFAVAAILEIMFLLLFAEVSIILKNYIKPIKKVRPLIISVVNTPHKKKVAVPPKKNAVPVKDIRKIIHKKPLIKRIVKPVPFKVRHISIPVPPTEIPVPAMVASNIEPVRSSNIKIPVSVLDKYFGEIKSKIEENLVYPGSARRDGKEGYVEVLFKLLRNGNLVFEKIRQPSEYGTLNESAIKTIKISSPFIPFPNGINRNSLTFLIKIHFKLNQR